MSPAYSDGESTVGISMDTPAVPMTAVPAVASPPQAQLLHSLLRAASMRSHPPTSPGSAALAGRPLSSSSSTQSGPAFTFQLNSSLHAAAPVAGSLPTSALTAAADTAGSEVAPAGPPLVASPASVASASAVTSVSVSTQGPGLSPAGSLPEGSRLDSSRSRRTSSQAVTSSLATMSATGKKPLSGSSLSGLPAQADVTNAVGKPVAVQVYGPPVALHTPQAATLTSREASLRREGKLVLSMVGLPARGKTAIARRLRRHLTWLGLRADIYNVGSYRRKYLGAMQPAAFFDPHNASGMEARAEMARLALEDMVAAMADGSIDIAIFDATNSTMDRREWLTGALADHGRRLGMKFQLVFIESVCNDMEIIRSNIAETKLKMPDYKGQDEATAVSDFLQRISHYASVYEPIDEVKEGGTPYIKLIDVGRQLIANRINGYLNSRIMFFLSNLHITPRPIFLSRHGESEFNVAGRIGGDSLLSPRGYAYALKLGAFMRGMYPMCADASGAAGASPSAGGGGGMGAGAGVASPAAASLGPIGSPTPGASASDGSAEASHTDLLVWTSNLRRTVATAAPMGRDIIRWTELNEIDAGVCDGMTYETIAATMPEEYAARGKNKYRYRYPRGESYEDIAHRLEPVIIELMRTKGPVLIVSHQATLRVLYAYLTDKPPESCPEELIPLHTVIQLIPRAYGCESCNPPMLDDTLVGRRATAVVVTYGWPIPFTHGLFCIRLFSTLQARRCAMNSCKGQREYHTEGPQQPHVRDAAWLSISLFTSLGGSGCL